MSGIARLFTQTVSTEPYLGVAGGVAKYGAPVSKSCFINDTRKLMRDANGVEVVSSTTLYGHLADIGAFVVGSRVTVNGRKAFVIGANRRDSAGPARIHHIQVELT